MVGARHPGKMVIIRTEMATHPIITPEVRLMMVATHLWVVDITLHSTLPTLAINRHNISTAEGIHLPQDIHPHLKDILLDILIRHMMDINLPLHLGPIGIKKYSRIKAFPHKEIWWLPLFPGVNHQIVYSGSTSSNQFQQQNRPRSPEAYVRSESRTVQDLNMDGLGQTMTNSYSDQS